MFGYDTNLNFQCVTFLFLAVLKPSWQVTGSANFFAYTVNYALSFFFKIY